VSADPAAVTGGSAHQSVLPSRGTTDAEQSPEAAAEGPLQRGSQVGLWVGLGLAVGIMAGPVLYWLTTGR
jgi:hypothetical protein